MRARLDMTPLKSKVRSSNQDGFTLIELLITLAITAFIGLLASQLVSTGFKTQVGVKNSAQQLENTVRIWLRLDNDINQIVQRPIRNERGERELDLRLEDNILTFTRSGWSNPLQEDRSTFQRVEYRFNEEASQPKSTFYRKSKAYAESSKETGELVRRFWRVLDRAPDSKPVDQEFSHVTEFSVQAMTKDGRWVSNWPPQSGQLGESMFPLALKVTLGVNNKPPFERTFLLMSKTAPQAKDEASKQTNAIPSEGQQQRGRPQQRERAER